MPSPLLLPQHTNDAPSNVNAVATEPIFSDSDCDKIIREAEAEGTVPGLILGQGKVPTSRRSNISWLTDRGKWKWVYDRVFFNIGQINREAWIFDLHTEESIQFSHYDHHEKGHYDWHTDTTGSRDRERKLSFSLQLSDPRHYDGGQLTLWPDVEMTRQRGCCIIFPSYLPHRVASVESGTRYALVGWVQGPAFK